MWGYLWVTFGLVKNTISIHKHTLTNPLTQEFIPTQWGTRNKIFKNYILSSIEGMFKILG